MPRGCEGLGALGPSVPASPPPDLIDELDAAAAVLRRLGSRGLDLRLEIEEAAGLVRVHVRDDRGRVMGELSPAAALDLLAGTAAGW